MSRAKDPLHKKAQKSAMRLDGDDIKSPSYHQLLDCYGGAPWADDKQVRVGLPGMRAVDFFLGKTKARMHLSRAELLDPNQCPDNWNDKVTATCLTAALCVPIA